MKAPTPLRTALTSSFSPVEAIATARLALAFGPLTFLDRELPAQDERRLNDYPEAA